MQKRDVVKIASMLNSLYEIAVVELKRLPDFEKLLNHKYIVVRIDGSCELATSLAEAVDADIEYIFGFITYYWKNRDYSNLGSIFFGIVSSKGKAVSRIEGNKWEMKNFEFKRYGYSYKIISAKYYLKGRKIAAVEMKINDVSDFHKLFQLIKGLDEHCENEKSAQLYLNFFKAEISKSEMEEKINKLDEKAMHLNWEVEYYKELLEKIEKLVDGNAAD